MFCHHCGEKQLIGSKFCSSCGKGLKEVPDKKREKTSPTKPAHTAMLLLPLLTLLLTGGGVYGYYTYEVDHNHKVSKWKQQAEELALKGEYDEAIQYIRKAKAVRPDYTILTEELRVIEKAKDYKGQLDQISGFIKKRDFESASGQLEKLKDEQKKEADAPLIIPFSTMIKDTEITITVGKTKQEIDKLTTIDELANKLNVVESLKTAEAVKVKEQIINRMVQITSDEAEVALQDNNFSNALAIVDKTLSHSGEDKTLTALKETIQQKKISFEKAEEERIQQAMEVAAKEDLKNRTEAVELVSLEPEVDEYGDVRFFGEIKNVATTSIYSVGIEYSVYGLDGSLLTTGFTSTYPYSITPGETALFNDSVYGVYDDTPTVEVDNITWYVE